MKDNLIYGKSFEFSKNIVKYYQIIKVREMTMSKQLLRSGTSICANVSEAIHAQSRNDFISKMNIALKEAKESEYWLKLLNQTGYLENVRLIDESIEIIRILAKIVKTSTNNSKNNL